MVNKRKEGEVNSSQIPLRQGGVLRSLGTRLPSLLGVALVGGNSVRSVCMIDCITPLRAQHGHLPIPMQQGRGLKTGQAMARKSWRVAWPCRILGEGRRCRAG